MEEMLIINPRRRRARNGRFVKSSRRRRRNPIAAANPRRRRRRNPIAAAANPRRRRRRNPIAAVANPRRRRRRNPISAVANNPRRRRYRRHHNPRGLSLGSFKPRAVISALIPAGVGALGAIGLDLAMSKIPLPIQLQTPLWRNVVRIVGAIALGGITAAVVGRSKGAQVGLGALTVVSYKILSEQIAQNFPSLGLSGAEQYDYSDLRLGYTNPAAMLTGAGGVGAYMPSSMPQAAAGIGAYMGRGGLDNVNALGGVVGDGL